MRQQDLQTAQQHGLTNGNELMRRIEDGRRIKSRSDDINATHNATPS